MSSPLLEVNHLKKYFKTRSGMLHAVDDVSFVLQPGETLGVVGESGCGKSTLGRTLVRLLDPTSGEIRFKGTDISGIKGSQLKDLRTHIQMIFQDPFSSLNPRKTVRESILEPLRLNGRHSAVEMEERVNELMDTVGLAQRLAYSYPHELDGGRRQRIGIARALALQPEFIVCDEPVSALDVSIQAQILNLMQDVQEERKLAYLFITHDLSVVHHMANRIMVMYLGQMVELCSGDDLFEHQYHPYTQALLSAIPTPTLHQKKRILLKGEITSPIDPPEGCRFARRCPYECHAGVERSIAWTLCRLQQGRKYVSEGEKRNVTATTGFSHTLGRGIQGRIPCPVSELQLPPGGGTGRRASRRCSGTLLSEGVYPDCRWTFAHWRG